MSIRPYNPKRANPGEQWWIIDLGRKGKRHIPFQGSEAEAIEWEYKLKKSGVSAFPRDENRKKILPRYHPALKNGDYIYFIQQGKSGPIKIGYTSTSINKRLAALQTATHEPLRLIAFIKGGTEELESTIHEKFKELRLRGEWFLPSVELKEYILEITKDPIRKEIKMLFKRLNELLNALPHSEVKKIREAFRNNNLNLLEDILNNIDS